MLDLPGNAQHQVEIGFQLHARYPDIAFALHPVFTLGDRTRTANFRSQQGCQLMDHFQVVLCCQPTSDTNHAFGLAEIDAAQRFGTAFFAEDFLARGNIAELSDQAVMRRVGSGRLHHAGSQGDDGGGGIDFFLTEGQSAVHTVFGDEISPVDVYGGYIVHYRCVQ
ncbi:hypothetical protein D3C80_1283130 [compost metagenome]